MFHKGLCDDVRGGGFVYGHLSDLGTTLFITNSKLEKRTFCSMWFKLISCLYFVTHLSWLGPCDVWRNFELASPTAQIVKTRILICSNLNIH